MKPVFLKMPDGRRMRFNTLNEMNKFIEQDEKEERKRKKKLEENIDTTAFKKKEKK